MWPFKRKKPRVIRPGDIPESQLKAYRKTALSPARVLTEADVQEFNGVIQTKEGPVPFVVGDYLNRGVEGEVWPITKKDMLDSKEPVSEPDSEGWQKWRNKHPVKATRIDEPFTVKLPNGGILTGKAGDFYVEDGPRSRIVDLMIFLKTYGPAT